MGSQRVGHDSAAELVEPIKTILMDLFAGKDWRRKYREETCGHKGKERGGQMEKVALIYV